MESFRLTPDGAQVVFRADKLVNGRTELFSVPVDGSSPPLRLDPLDRTATEVYRISPDGSFVVFATHHFNIDRLHRVPIDAGGPPLQLADSGVPSGTDTYFEDVKLASDGLHAAYDRRPPRLPAGRRAVEPGDHAKEVLSRVVYGWVAWVTSDIDTKGTPQLFQVRPVHNIWSYLTAVLSIPLLRVARGSPIEARAG